MQKQTNRNKRLGTLCSLQVTEGTYKVTNLVMLKEGKWLFSDQQFFVH